MTQPFSYVHNPDLQQGWSYICIWSYPVVHLDAKDINSGSGASAANILKH